MSCLPRVALGLSWGEVGRGWPADQSRVGLACCVALRGRKRHMPEIVGDSRQAYRGHHCSGQAVEQRRAPRAGC